MTQVRVPSDWCVQEMQRQTECGLTRVSLLIQTGDVTRRKGKGKREKDRIVYPINRLKEKQVPTYTNLFCAAEVEDRLARSVDVLVLRNSSTSLCALLNLFEPAFCVSLSSLFVIIFIKVGINNTGGET